MSEPKINVSTGFGGGVSVSLRGDTGQDIESLLADAAQTSPTLTRLLQQAGILVTEAQAIATVHQVFPGAQPTTPSPVSTVGQPLPQPGVSAPAPAAQPAGNPPGVEYPGNCEHGVRVYVDKPAKGKPWRRWECAIRWSKDGVYTHNGQPTERCKPVNV